MRKNIILLITHIILAICCVTIFVWSIVNSLEIGFSILMGIVTACWLGHVIIDFIEIVGMMKME